MSTEWHFFAFDHPSFERYVAGPLRSAATTSDAEAWFRTLSVLSNVYPPSRLTPYSVQGFSRPVTSVEWYTGRPDLPVDVPPAADAESLQALLKVSLEALAELRLTGSCSKPRGVFSELGYPERLASEGLQQQFGQLAAEFFWRRADLPHGYEFLGPLNQGCGVVLPQGVRELADAEVRNGLLQTLATELATGEWADLATDLGDLRPFLVLAAHRNLALYYREDAT